MKGYKASENHICRDFKFDVGQTYKILGKLEICENGFHFCEEIDDVLEYYDADQNLVVFEIEALGEIITKGDKSVTDEIKILREIPVSEYNELFKRTKFDERGNCIYRKYLSGNEFHYKYDKNNNLIYTKYPNGHELYSNSFVKFKMKILKFFNNLF